MIDSHSLAALQRNLIFVSGKGGVGKTTFSQALAQALAREGKKVLWVEFENPTQPAGKVRSIRPGLSHLNCEATSAFDEYVGIKIGIPGLAKLFVKNKLIQYLAQAGPGIHELVLLGKVWHDRNLYDHTVVDMPSTGYGLAMFQSVANFARLFRSGPLHADTESMLQTFRDAQQCSHLILALPEEMPLQEGIELGEFLQPLFPQNTPSYWVNRAFPVIDPALCPFAPEPNRPVARDLADFALNRSLLEKQNTELWRQRGIDYQTMPYFLGDTHSIVQQMTQVFEKCRDQTP